MNERRAYSRHDTSWNNFLLSMTSLLLHGLVLGEPLLFVCCCFIHTKNMVYAGSALYILFSRLFLSQASCELVWFVLVFGLAATAAATASRSVVILLLLVLLLLLLVLLRLNTRDRAVVLLRKRMASYPTTTTNT